MQNGRENLNLQWLLNDPIYEACMRLCLNSPNRRRQSYGALLVNPQGVVVSVARNISVRTGEPWRLMGCSNHAEGMAIFLAELYGRRVKGSQLYVGGVLEDGVPFIHGEQARFTCGQCATLVEKYGMTGINIPTTTGWQFLDTRAAQETARQFKQETINNSSGRKSETVEMDGELVKEIKSRILGHKPKETIQRLRSIGMGITREAAGILSLTTNGYPLIGEFKQRARSLL